jgi:hypothetical protein
MSSGRRPDERVKTGRCYCGAVQFEIVSLGALVNCHCRFCRRVSGAAFTTVALVPTSDLHFTAGEEVVRRCASGEGSRFFCSECGTRLFNRPASTEEITMLVVGTLDDEPASPPVMHINVESKAPWYAILDDLPQHPGLPGEATKILSR